VTRARAALFALALLVTAGPALSLNLDLPGDATLTHEDDRGADTYFLPVGPVVDGAIPTKELEGRVVRQAWRIEGEGLSTLGLMTTIRDQLSGDGYELLLDCTTDECGGFDFRFSTDVLPAPNMFVDLFDFRFVSARNARVEGAEYISALVSRAGQAGYIQLVLVGSDTAPVVVSQPVTSNANKSDEGLETPSGDVVSRLTADGHAVLSDLVFATGSSDLANGPYLSLQDLAAFLNADTNRRVALVGHTDAVGALDDNIALSRQRAASVMQRLIQNHAVSEVQLESNGMGYLAPVATNASAEGRRANRRVEAVLLNTE
jgi:OOP family OmpA-OmpF porin